MKRTVSLVAATLFVIALVAQKYDQAVVAEVNYVCKVSPMMEQDEFPMYFHEEEFIADVHDQIEKLVKEKFSVDKVVFVQPDSIHYKYGMPKVLKAKELSTQIGGKAIVLSIETKLTAPFASNDMVNYHFITTIASFNGKGKKVYKYKNTIPFISEVRDNITGTEKMGEGDFYAFYFDGLDAAFKGVHKKVDKRYIERPTTSHYDEFLAEAQKFYIIQTKDGYAYGNDPDNLKDVIAFKYDFWKSFGGGEFDMADLFSSNTVKEGYKMNNLFLNEDYVVKFAGGTSSFFNFFDFTKMTKAVFYQNKEEIGSFNFDDWDDLYGSFGSDQYNMVVNPQYLTSEVRHNDSMFALVHNAYDMRVIYMKQSASEEQLGQFFNLVFAYDFAFYIREKAIEMQENDDDN